MKPLCDQCGVEVPKLKGQVTVGGWYGNHRFRWHLGKLVVDRVSCDDCKPGCSLCGGCSKKHPAHNQVGPSPKDVCPMAAPQED